MLDDGAFYSKHRTLQTHDTKSFLASTIKHMNWSNEEKDVVMDMGCGSGDAWRNILLPSFPKVKRVVAVDALPSMIEYAKKNNAFDNIEYHVVDIQKYTALEKWAGQITKVISIFCLHWLDEQEEAFRNIYNVLKPGGEAALLFALTCALWESYDVFHNNEKWTKYIQNSNPRVPVSHIKKYNSSFYREFLEKIGFEIRISKEEDRAFIYPNDEEWKDAVFSICGFASYIPDELKAEFKEDLLKDTLMKYHGRNSDGKPMFKYRTLSLLMKKM